MTLRETQSTFAQCIARLILHVDEMGLAVTLGEGKVYERRRLRDGTEAMDGVHMQGSVHYVGLAMDLNLFKNGHYLEDGSLPEWLALGEWWEKQHPLARWGGRFGSKDSNHFSFTNGGKA